jgi:hypothetical protein
MNAYSYRTNKHVRANGTVYYSYVVFARDRTYPRYVFNSVEHGIATQLRATAVRYAQADIRALNRNDKHVPKRE